jgi:sulfoquinovosidase
MKHFKWILLLTLATLGLGYTFGSLLHPRNFPLTGTLTVLESGAPTGVSQVGEYLVEWDNANGGQLTVRNEAGKVLWQTVAGEAFVSAARGEETVSENRGMFQMRDRLLVTCTRQTVDLILENAPGTVTISGHLYCDDNSSTLYNLHFEQRNPENLGMTAWLLDPQTFTGETRFNRIFLTSASSADEHFFGFGEQFTYFDMKGKRVPIWVSEQGVGRGEEPITTGANITNGGAGGNAFTSYAPMPLYITNTMRGFLLTNLAYSAFDLRQSGPRASRNLVADHLRAHLQR